MKIKSRNNSKSKINCKNGKHLMSGIVWEFSSEEQILRAKESINSPGVKSLLDRGYIYYFSSMNDRKDPNKKYWVFIYCRCMPAASIIWVSNIMETSSGRMLDNDNEDRKSLIGQTLERYGGKIGFKVEYGNLF